MGVGATAKLETDKMNEMLGSIATVVVAKLVTEEGPVVIGAGNLMGIDEAFDIDGLRIPETTVAEVLARVLAGFGVPELSGGSALIVMLEEDEVLVGGRVPEVGSGMILVIPPETDSNEGSGGSTLASRVEVGDVLGGGVAEFKVESTTEGPGPRLVRPPSAAETDSDEGGGDRKEVGLTLGGGGGVPELDGGGAGGGSILVTCPTMEPNAEVTDPRLVRPPNATEPDGDGGGGRTVGPVIGGGGVPELDGGGGGGGSILVTCPTMEPTAEATDPRLVRPPNAAEPDGDEGGGGREVGPVVGGGGGGGVPELDGVTVPTDPGGPSAAEPDGVGEVLGGGLPGLDGEDGGGVTEAGGVLEAGVPRMFPTAEAKVLTTPPSRPGLDDGEGDAGVGEEDPADGVEGGTV